MPTKYKAIFDALAAPFKPEEVKVLPKGPRPKYVTARTVMNRLDEVLGPEGWWDDYIPHEESVQCRLSIRLPDGTVLTKEDAGGYPGMSDQGDDDKGGFSDAFKRAAVKFRVARYLYGDGIGRLVDAPASDRASGDVPGQARAEAAPARNGRSESSAPSHAPASAAPGGPGSQHPGLDQPPGEGEAPAPAPAPDTFWSRLIDEINRINSAFLADHDDYTDEATIVDYRDAVAYLVEKTYARKLHETDPETDQPIGKWVGLLDGIYKEERAAEWMRKHIGKFLREAYAKADAELAARQPS